MSDISGATGDFPIAPLISNTSGIVAPTQPTQPVVPLFDPYGSFGGGIYDPNTNTTVTGAQGAANAVQGAASGAIGAYNAISSFLSGAWIGRAIFIGIGGLMLGFGIYGLAKQGTSRITIVPGELAT